MPPAPWSIPAIEPPDMSWPLWSIAAVEPPAIADTPTVAMSTVATTVVEGGTETRSHADTVNAYLDSGYVASVTVVTYPGSALPALGPDVAARLLAQTVTAVLGAGW